jgi:uncharacterized membrane protein
MMRACVFALLVVTITAPAHAYMGPLMSLGSIAAAFGVIGSFLLGLVGIVWYPIKRLYRRLRGHDEDDDNTPEPPAASQT